MIRHRFLLGAGAIVLLTLIAYWPVFGAGFIWDDDSYVTDNALLRSVEGLGRIWIPRQTPQYYPAVFTSFWIEHQLWGLDPLGYHVVNVLLHAVNAILVWRLCVLLRIPGAWLIGAVFAVHPINVESVAWITERKNVLSGFFYLTAALIYLRFEDAREKRETASVARIRYFVSLILFILALLSKTVTCSLPAALILMMLWQRKKITVGRILPLAPMFVIGFALAMHTAHLEQIHVGTWGPDFDLSFSQRLMIASRALWFYPLKVIAPWPLMFIYPRWDVAAWAMISGAALAAILLVAVACIVLFVRGRRGVPLAIAFYSGTIFPALGIFNIYPMRFSFVADHFAYLSSLGVIALVVGGLAVVFDQRHVAMALAAAALFGLTTLSHLRCMAYESEEILWRWTIQQNPRAYIAHNNLGQIVLMGGGADKAVEHFRKAVDLRRDLDDLRANLANALRLAGRPGEAVSEYEMIQTRHELLPKDQLRLAQALADLGRADEADAAFTQAISSADRADEARVLYGAFLAGHDRPEDAAGQFRGYLQAHPEDGFVHLMLGTVLIELGDNDEAASHLREALSIAQRTGDAELARQAQLRLEQVSHDQSPDR